MFALRSLPNKVWRQRVLGSGIALRQLCPWISASAFSSSSADENQKKATSKSRFASWLSNATSRFQRSSVAIRARMRSGGFSNQKEELDPGEVEVVHFTEELRRTAEGMLLLMYAADGIGLAAPQVGVNLRLMVFNETGNPDETEEEMVLCNPHITSSSEETSIKEEACLSFPNIYGNVRRALHIEVKFQDMDGEHQTMWLQGLAARVFLHEYDHLDRVLFIDHFSPRDKARAKRHLEACIKKFGVGAAP